MNLNFLVFLFSMSLFLMTPSITMAMALANVISENGDARNENAIGPSLEARKGDIFSGVANDWPWKRKGFNCYSTCQISCSDPSVAVEIKRFSLEGFCDEQVERLLLAFENDATGQAEAAQNKFWNFAMAFTPVIHEGKLYTFAQAGELSLEQYLEGSDYPGRECVLPQYYDWIKNLMQALEYLEEMDIVHGNICPRNIIFISGSTLPVLTGFVSQASLELGRANQLIDYRYAPQEVIRDNEISHKADIYASQMVAMRLFLGQDFSYFCPDNMKAVFAYDKANDVFIASLSDNPSDRPVAIQLTVIWNLAISILMESNTEVKVIGSWCSRCEREVPISAKWAKTCRYHPGDRVSLQMLGKLPSWHAPKLLDASFWSCCGFEDGKLKENRYPYYKLLKDPKKYGACNNLAKRDGQLVPDHSWGCTLDYHLFEKIDITNEIQYAIWPNSRKAWRTLKKVPLEMTVKELKHVIEEDLRELNGCSEEHCCKVSYLIFQYCPLEENVKLSEILCADLPNKTGFYVRLNDWVFNDI